MNRLKTLRIGSHRIGPDQPCFVIAEAGVNHNGKLERAIKLIDAAKEAGADCVKFQTFRAADLVTCAAPKALYQRLQTDRRESQRRMLEKLELPYENFLTLKKHCDKRGILFLSTPYGVHDADFLQSIHVAAFKVASGQLVEPMFLKHIARMGKPMLVSTGMGTLGEVSDAVRAVRSTGNQQLVVLQCTTNYPSVPQEANLRVIPELAKRFQVLMGYSDHTATPWSAIASIALGACVIEKHFTLNKALPGPDHAASMNPAELVTLVRGIRTAQSALGDGEKKPSAAERLNAPAMRRSLATTQYIPKGTRLTASMLSLKRPGTGMAPKQWDSVIGRRARRDLPADTTLTASFLTGSKSA